VYIVKLVRAWITPLIALVIAFGIGAILMITQGSDPIRAYESLFTTAFSTQEGLAKTFGKATPLAISGLAVVIGLRAGLFNIGAQGQLISGALARRGLGMQSQGCQ
jgi:general nucleoside transport system permease protein